MENVKLHIKQYTCCKYKSVWICNLSQKYNQNNIEIKDINENWNIIREDNKYTGQNSELENHAYRNLVIRQHYINIFLAFWMVC